MIQTELLLNNLLSAPILCFFLGAIAVFCRSDLEVPASVAKFFSLYLLFVIGLKGGMALQESGLNLKVIMELLLGVLVSVIITTYTFFALKARLGVKDAAAVSATFGSISVVTFITAATFLEQIEVTYDGYLVAMMALMESPAIVMGLLLYRLFSESHSETASIDWKELLRDSFFNGSIFLLMGSLIIGSLISESQVTQIQPFSSGIFTGILCLFLLEMGISAAKQWSVFKQAGGILIMASIAFPLINAALGVALALWAGMSVGNAYMFTILCASASYIAVPAAMKLAIPQARPGIYLSMSLAITFPFNIIIGIPLYFEGVQWIWGA